MLTMCQAPFQTLMKKSAPPLVIGHYVSHLRNSKISCNKALYFYTLLNKPWDSLHLQFILKIFLDKYCDLFQTRVTNSFSHRLSEICSFVNMRSAFCLQNLSLLLPLKVSLKPADHKQILEGFTYKRKPGVSLCQDRQWGGTIQLPAGEPSPSFLQCSAYHPQYLGFKI